MIDGCTDEEAPQKCRAVKDQTDDHSNALLICPQELMNRLDFGRDRVKATPLGRMVAIAACPYLAD